MEYLEKLKKGYEDERARQLAQFKAEKELMPLLQSDDVSNLCLAYQLYPRKKRIVNIIASRFEQLPIKTVYKKYKSLITSPNQVIEFEEITKEEFYDRSNYEEGYFYYEYDVKSFGIVSYESIRIGV